MEDYLEETTFTDELIAFLFSARSNSIRKSILWDRVKKRRNISKPTYYQSLYRLKKKGLIENKDNLFKLSKKGLTYYKNSHKLIRIKLNKKNRIILIFDIPENQKKTREWLRRQIKSWDFKMIQKSVWSGFGPLPRRFNERLKFLKIDKCIKIFKVQIEKR